MSAAAAKTAGFTLVEVLIALFIFSLISVGATSALTTSLRAKAQMASHAERLSDIDRARALMIADLGAVTRREMRDSGGSVLPYSFIGGADVLLALSRTGRDNPGGLAPRGDVQRVEYRLIDGALERRVLAHASPAPTTPWISQILLTDISRAQISFFSQGQMQTQVLLPSGSAAPLPSRAALSLTFKNGDKLDQYFEIAP